jgi:hypothetical protein
MVLLLEQVLSMVDGVNGVLVLVVFKLELVQILRLQAVEQVA